MRRGRGWFGYLRAAVVGEVIAGTLHPRAPYRMTPVPLRINYVLVAKKSRLPPHVPSASADAVNEVDPHADSRKESNRLLRRPVFHRDRRPAPASKQTPIQPAQEREREQKQEQGRDGEPSPARVRARGQEREADSSSGSTATGTLSAFEHGFRVGRAEGMLALVDAMTRSIESPADMEPRSDPATPASSRARLELGGCFTVKARPSILIVDDESINIDLLIDNLETDFEVLAATDGKAALETALRELPDLILLDILMPGLDGFEVCRRLKGNRQTQNIPIIFITALTDANEEIRGLELGAQDFLTKPIQPMSVKARINSHVRLKYAHDKLLWLATLEQRLRENLFEALESKSGLN
jgi:CheY-like chemotaxis protein